MLVITGVPYLTRALLASGVGVATLDELNATRCALIGGWSHENVNVIGHDDERVEAELSCVAITEESLDEEFGAGSSLEMPWR
jgi:hypothetical protein